MRLRAEGIDFCYNCGTKILENLNFCIESGEVVGMFAPSGFGKTTLTKILAGYLKPERGRVVIEDCSDGTENYTMRHIDVASCNCKNYSQAEQNARQQSRGSDKTIDLANHKGYNPVQLIFQHPEQAINPRWKMKKVLEEVGMPSRELMDAMGINDEWLNRWPSELSGGEMQRFCVLRALNPRTKFLIADEMTTMLDAITQVQIWEVVLDYAREHKIGVIVISHELPLLERVCDRIERL